MLRYFVVKQIYITDETKRQTVTNRLPTVNAKKERNGKKLFRVEKLLQFD